MTGAVVPSGKNDAVRITPAVWPDILPERHGLPAWCSPGVMDMRALTGR